MLCLNSLHSKGSILQKFPHLEPLVGLLYNAIDINVSYVDELESLKRSKIEHLTDNSMDSRQIEYQTRSILEVN